MDPEFKRLVIRVMMIGGAILAIGAGTLVVAFRAFAPVQSRGRDFRPVVLIAAVLFFVLVVCALLLRLSMIR